MRRRLRQNATNVSEIYIGRPIYISASDVYIRHPGTYNIRAPIFDIRLPISDVRYIKILDIQYLYPMSDVQYPTSANARARARARAGISDVRYIYMTYWTSDIDLGNIGGILS